MFKRFMQTLGIRVEGELSPTVTFADERLESWRRQMLEHEAPDSDPWTALALIACKDLAPEGYAKSDRITRLNFGRSVLGLVINNDRLPPRQQLSTDKLETAFSLLRSFFFKPEAVEEAAQATLRVVEGCVSTTELGQARVLLDLFDTEPATRRQNELNLFYEGMLHRFQVPEEGTLSEDAVAGTRSELLELLAGDGPALGQAAAKIATHWGVHLHINASLPLAMQRWQEIIPSGISPERRAKLLEQVADRRLRAIHERPPESVLGALTDAINERSSQECLQELAIAHIFIARMSGRTGTESMLGTFFRWMEQSFQGPAIRVLPEIYRGLSLGTEPLTELAERVCEEFMTPNQELVFSSETVADELSEILRELINAPAKSVAAGDYDLGSLLHSRLIGYRPDNFAYSMRMHRIL